jgi:hypothetical protein
MEPGTTEFVKAVIAASWQGRGGAIRLLVLAFMLLTGDSPANLGTTDKQVNFKALCG